MINPLDLLTHKRWDIVIKYVYIKYYHYYQQQKNKNPKDIEWFQKLYTDHLKVLNGGYEVKTYYQKEKTNLNDFIADFHQLYHSIKTNGFDSKYPIPITKNNIILNGAHRIAISTLLDIKLPIEDVSVNGNSSLEYPPEAFNNRSRFIMPKSKASKSNILNGLGIKQQEFVFKEYVELKKKRLRFLVFFDHYNFNHHKVKVLDYLKNKNYLVVHQKTINLTLKGTFNLVKHLYYTEPKVNIFLKTSHAFLLRNHKDNLLPDQFKCHIVLIESTTGNFGKISPSGAPHKTHLRNILGSNDLLHVSDNSDETVRLARLFYHQSSLEILNSLNIQNEELIKNKFEKYQNGLKGHYNSDKFMIVSSLLLGLLGLRKPNDLDFIYDDSIIKNQKLFLSSHNQYRHYYSSFFLLLYHPDYHIYYMSEKMINLDQLKLMKSNRSETKDLIDLALINLFQKYHHLRNQLSIITTTHALPSAPSTKIIETTLDNFHLRFPGSSLLDHWIYFDSREDSVSLKYWNNLLKLQDKYPNIILVKTPHSGLKQNYLQGIRSVFTPYLFFLEHDWIFLENVNINKIINQFNDHKTTLHYLKFNKRKNKEKGGWDQILKVDPKIKGFTAIKTNSWTNHPHFARKQKWMSDWFKLVADPRLNSMNKSYGIEEILYHYYQHDIKRLGFDKAHHKWGCYNYGSESGEAILEHLDGSENYSSDSIDGRKIIL